MIEEVCVKCGKPVNLGIEDEVLRCPWCKDFFKPEAELIFLIEERSEALKRIRPGEFLARHPKLSRLLLAILAFTAVLGLLEESIVSLWALLPLCAIGLQWFRRMRSPLQKEIDTLENQARFLESEYQKSLPQADRN